MRIHNIFSLGQIKERKRIEERFRNMFENIQDVYYEVSTEGTILEISPSIKLLSNGLYDRESLLGQSVYEMYAKSDDRDILMNHLYVGGEVRDYEITLKNRDGSIFQCSISAKLCYNDHHKSGRIVGIMRDISIRKRAEEEIRNKNEQLHILNSEKDKLFSIIAHDLRTPFSAFIGLTEFMLKKDLSLTPEDTRKFLGTIHSSAISLYGLLENLLLWSGNKQGSLQFTPQKILLLPLAKEATTALKDMAIAKNINIIYNVPENLQVKADRNFLETIIRNLMSNALKFTPRGGSITLTARLHENNKVEVAVEDTGIGIEEEMLGKLFSIQNKVNRLGTEGEPSTGLGLLLCKEFVEKHNGKLSVSSEVNKGSRFSFII